MADEQTEEQNESAPGNAGKRLLVIAVVIVVLLAAGGGGYYFWSKKAHSNSNHANSDGNEKEVTQVIELAPFIVNLADREEPKYLRMTVSLGIGEGGTEGKPDPLYTTKVRNAILAIVTTKTAEEILTVEGKTALRREMLSAARAAVDRPTVHAIYITDFIVQM